MNLFLTEDGVLKLGYYGLTTQTECYSIKRKNCDGIRSFAPEVLQGRYKTSSDVWSLGVSLIEMIGETPYPRYRKNCIPPMDGYGIIAYYNTNIKSKAFIDFIDECFGLACSMWEVDERWSVKELMNVSVIR